MNISESKQLFNEAERALAVSLPGAGHLCESELTSENVMMYAVAAYIRQNDGVMKVCRDFIEKLLEDATDKIDKKTTELMQAGTLTGDILDKLSIHFVNDEPAPSWVDLLGTDTVVERAIIASCDIERLNPNDVKKADNLIMYMAAAMYNYDRNGMTHSCWKVLYWCWDVIHDLIYACACQIAEMLGDDFDYSTLKEMNGGSADNCDEDGNEDGNDEDWTDPNYEDYNDRFDGLYSGIFRMMISGKGLHDETA